MSDILRQKIRYLIQWVRKFIREKFHSENEDLPYYVTILVATIIFLIALNGFIQLTSELAENELGGFDEAVSSFVTSYRMPWLTRYFIMATHLGQRNA
jgi:uncharacterized BrkB/YihY/UPF0761 family membrane protein